MTKLTKQDQETIAWAAMELLELDEMGRSMVPAYESFNSEDMERVAHLKEIAARKRPQGDFPG